MATWSHDLSDHNFRFDDKYPHYLEINGCEYTKDEIKDLIEYLQHVCSMMDNYIHFEGKNYTRTKLVELRDQINNLLEEDAEGEN